MEVIPYRKEGILCINFNREFSIRNIPDVEVLWDDAKKNGTRVVAFEFINLEFIDSSAIGTMVKYLNEASSSGIEIVILNAGTAINKIFTTARLTRLFKFISQSEFEEKYLTKH